MEQYAAECFDTLQTIYSSSDISLIVKYRQLRQLLDWLCRELTQNESLQMTDLSARINFLALKYKLDIGETNRLHTFRMTANEVLNHRSVPDESLLLRDIKTIAFAIRKIFETDIPRTLYQYLPKTVFVPAETKKEITRIKRLRVCFHYADKDYMYVAPVDIVTNELVKVQYRGEDIKNTFIPTIDRLWKLAQLNLLDVIVNEEDIYIPSIIVLEPDYLIDISSLAECFKDYGAHPANYIVSKLTPVTNTLPVLTGNIANLFLDECIYNSDHVDYLTCMQKAFKMYAIEIAACQELLSPDKEKEFFVNCKKHFQHIKETVIHTFGNEDYRLNKDDALLEPSYICEALGLQGRLDYMQRDMSAFIEMKSGKADEYSILNKVSPKENNLIQMLLYMAVLEYNMEKKHQSQHPYLLYTRYPLLYPARTSWTLVKKAINLRNLIVADEYEVQYNNSSDYTYKKLLTIEPEVLNEKKLRGRFWEQYLSPPLQYFNESFRALSESERAYYTAIYNFITKEQYLSKSGDSLYEGRGGAASLWLSSFAEKCEAGEILYDLLIIDNQAAADHKASIVFSLPKYKEEVYPNFRTGDVVLFYERNSKEDNVNNKLVFKGTLEDITNTTVKVRLRSKQSNKNVLSEDSLYAIERDSMDTGYKAMFQGLHSFSTACKERRKLLLCQHLPSCDGSFKDKIERAETDFERVAWRARAANDYFLLIGPPGTGKTSRALRKMVEIYHQEPEKQILLLAYTNKAVDEICKSVLSIDNHLNFIRVGSELSCEEAYRGYLIENVLSDCVNRSQVNGIFSNCRIVVGTVAAISNKPELFRLKTFDIAIIDEASQILEPQLLGILCAKNQRGENALKKFVLIGDHKQLPAVVLQSEDTTSVNDPLLNKIGIRNLSESLFERLYRFNSDNGGDDVIDMLCKQGRMHPEVARFPNLHFYEGKLDIVGLPHQLQEKCLSESSSFISPIINKRVSFIDTNVDRNSITVKTNLYEVQVVTWLCKHLYLCHQSGFDPLKTLGVITPYRSQIALIRRELEKLGMPELSLITVDTVERFQGSERDIIIYSFCVNQPWQLRQLVNKIEEKGVSIDRKLNVALTRSRNQLFLIGNAGNLKKEFIYNQLLDSVKDHFNSEELLNSYE